MSIDRSENSLLCTIQVPFKEHFEPLGFHLDILDSRYSHGKFDRVYITNEHVKLFVGHRFSAIGIRLEPLCVEITDTRCLIQRPPNAPLPSSTMVSDVYLFDAIEVLAPTVTEYESYPRNLYYLEPELHRQFALICNHLQGLLNGNEDDWERVRRFVQYGRGTCIFENEDFNTYLVRLQKTAKEAYDNHEYHKADRFYEALRRNKLLSLRDFLRHREAKSHRIMID